MQEETLFEFPCQFSVKAMGLASEDLVLVVSEIVEKHVTSLPQDAVKTKPSKGGKYLSITITFEATSKAQLDAIYMDLTAHEKVLMSL